MCAAIIKEAHPERKYRRPRKMLAQSRHDFRKVRVRIERRPMSIEKSRLTLIYDLL